MAVEKEAAGKPSKDKAVVSNNKKKPVTVKPVTEKTEVAKTSASKPAALKPEAVKEKEKSLAWNSGIQCKLPYYLL